MLGGGGYTSKGQQRFVLAVLDLDAPAVRAEPLDVGFLPHGVCVHPTHAHLAALFEKNGPGACLVDLRARAVVRTLTTPRSRRFYGHGAWSPDGSVLYATESRVDRANAGLLVARDGVTFAETGAVTTHGTAPHDCLLLDGGRVMVVAHGGGPYHDASPAALPSVTWVELASAKLLERATLGSRRFNAGHLALTDAGDLALVSAPREGLGDPAKELGALSLRPRGEALRTVTAPAAVVRRMLGETLSVAIHAPTRLVAATHPLGDCVTLWGMDDGAHRGTLELRAPRGVAFTLDLAWLLVSHMAPGGPRVTAFDAQTLAPVAHVEPSWLTGSHVTVHPPLPAA